MAHQDVVPAMSVSKWTYPPFSAHFDGQWLWGRGSSDCKNNLVGFLSVIEDLLSQNFKPHRTILLAFGFDEETGGKHGARHMASELEKRYGNNSFAMLMDEGGMGLQPYGDKVYALPGVAEKGFTDLVLTVETAGGHSSRPPRHSAIGIMSKMIVELEARPFQPVLAPQNPFRGLLECQVRHSPQEVEPWLRRALVTNESETEMGTRLAEARDESVRFSLQTSQAVDIVRGGEKDNQLPESVTATINYRIAPHDGIEKVRQHAVGLLTPLARSHGLAIQGFGVEEAKTDAGVLIMKTVDDLPPSPVSPTDRDNPVWRLFSGTIRAVFEDTEALRRKTVVPVGGIMLGNTDTVHYWNLSRNIYRFSPAREGTRVGVHTVDERLDMSVHLEGMRLYYDLIRNFDLAEDL